MTRHAVQCFFVFVELLAICELKIDHIILADCFLKKGGRLRAHKVKARLEREMAAEELVLLRH